MTQLKNPNRKHNKQVFYKYMPADTAKLVLSNNTLRWSSPLLFNDRFDVPIELAYDIPSSEIEKAITEIFIRIIEEPNYDVTHYCQEVIDIAGIMRNTTISKSAEIKRMLQEFPKTVMKQSNGLEEFRKMWREFIPDFRILSLTTNNKATSMWYHYADKYKGVTIELACKDKLDSPWLLAKPVAYPEEPPHIFSPEGLAEFIIMNSEIAFDKLLEAYTYTKTPDWKYEEEWRITSLKGPNDTGYFSDYAVNPENFIGLYFGPMVNKENRLELLEIAKNKLPSIKAYDVSFGMNRNFIFKEVNII